MKPKKESELFFSSLLNTVVTFFFFCLFKIETWKAVYPMMLKCNVCIAQCLLVGYYKSSDQSNKVVPFSIAAKCLSLYINWLCPWLCCTVCVTSINNELSEVMTYMLRWLHEANQDITIYNDRIRNSISVDKPILQLTRGNKHASIREN